MKVTIDDMSGFCFGVVNAIALAEKALAESGVKVNCLGDIVHNRIEMERLEKLGLGTVAHGDMAALQNTKLLIRAHGEPPGTYRAAVSNNVGIIDATCPVVAALQRTVADAHRKMTGTGGQVVILGKRGHAEVAGLTGQTTGGAPVIVVENETDLDAVDNRRPVYLLSQTTQSLGLFERVGRALTDRNENPDTVTIHDTICRQVANREPHLKKFAARHDVVIFVCGRKSSNGSLLYEACREANARSYRIEAGDELRGEWFGGARTVGVCGATSTPRWIMEKVAQAIENIE